MEIRKTTKGDLAQVMQIYEYAQQAMDAYGNKNQWLPGYPPEEMIIEDINSGQSYVCENNGKILAVFFFSIESDPTYAKIDGAWENKKPYGVIHRIARAEGAKGAGEFCINWCLTQTKNIRIDTHKDNAPMLKLLRKLGFKHCGTIWLANGDERLAFQKVVVSKFKERLSYSFSAALIAAAFYLFTTFIFEVVAEENILHATVWNIGAVIFFVLLEKTERFFFEKLRKKAEEKRLTLLLRLLKRYLNGPSVKSALYLFYIIVLICTAVLYADPSIEIPLGSSQYFASVRYGLLVLIAADKFTEQLFKDIKNDKDNA